MANRRVVVLGAGLERRALRRRAARDSTPDVEITIVERELAGGECSYYACLPTKTLLRPTEVLAAARLAPGAAEAITGEIDIERVQLVARPGHGRPRRLVARGMDRGARRGARARRRAHRHGPGPSPSASGRSSTTSSSSRPDRGRHCRALDGLEDVDHWTNRDAVWASEIPASLIVLGGGAVGVELAQFFRRLGRR